MNWIAIVVGGLIAGLIASAIVPGRSTNGLIASALVGIVGGILGKVVFHFVGLQGQSYSSPLWNLLVAVVGAVIVLVIYHALMSGRRPLAEP